MSVCGIALRRAFSAVPWLLCIGVKLAVDTQALAVETAAVKNFARGTDDL